MTLKMAYPKGKPGFCEPEGAGDPGKPRGNFVLSENVRLNADCSFASGTGLNDNVIVVGPEDQREPYILANLAQMNASFVVADPEGKILGKTREMLESGGYVVKVLDLTDGENPCAYSPFCYFGSDEGYARGGPEDVARAIMFNTEGDAEEDGSLTFRQAERGLLADVFKHIRKTRPEKWQTLGVVAEFFARGAAGLEEERPDEPDIFRRWESPIRDAGPVWQSVASRVSGFRRFTEDNLELDLLPGRKQAVFVIVPEADGGGMPSGAEAAAMAMVVSQVHAAVALAQERRERKTGGHSPSPVHVRVFLQDFAHLCSFPDIVSSCSVGRPRSVSYDILAGSVAELSKVMASHGPGLSFLGDSCASHVFMGEDCAEECRRFCSPYSPLLNSLDDVPVVDKDSCIVSVQGHLPVMDRVPAVRIGGKA